MKIIDYNFKFYNFQIKLIIGNKNIVKQTNHYQIKLNNLK